jgi:alpha-galactosidase
VTQGSVGLDTNYHIKPYRYGVNLMKVTIIGAGSTVFMRNIVRDLLQQPALVSTHIALQDIDSKRLQESQLVARQIISALKPSTVVDFDIPKKYGLRQTIADTLGIGGIMRGLRTVPVLVDIARDMRELCPNALLMNYVNPMAILSLAVQRMVPEIQYVGLCHSVQGTAEELAHDLGVEPANLVYTCAGINHMAFYNQFTQRLPDGSTEDLYPRLKALASVGNVPDGNRVRYEILRKFGYFVTESSEHFAEYSPWFIKRDRPDLIEKFNIPLDEYPRRCEKQIADWATELQHIETHHDIEIKQSREYAASIINSLATGEPSVIYGNVLNNGLIDNLPADCAVEVACLVDRNGVQPVKFGSVQPQLAALMRTNINVQQLTVEALMTNDLEYIYHAAYLDPHTSAELDLDQIHDLVDDLRRAHGDWLPKFARM